MAVTLTLAAASLSRMSEKAPLRPLDLPLPLLGNLFEGLGIPGNEVQLGSAARGKAGVGQEIDAGLPERGQGAGSLSGLVRNLDVEVLDALNGVHESLLE